MIFLKCPGCRGVVPLPLEAHQGHLVFIEGAELETFVHEHHAHLADDEYFDVIESAGDA